jgi:hypothetical protein
MRMPRMAASSSWYVPGVGDRFQVAPLRNARLVPRPYGDRGPRQAHPGPRGPRRRVKPVACVRRATARTRRVAKPRGPFNDRGRARRATVQAPRGP